MGVVSTMPAVNHPSAAASSAAVTPAVALRDAAVTRAGRLVWSHATLDVPPGSFTAIIGPNGSGKSTTAKLILGELKPSSGSVAVLGETPRRGNPRIGLVPQSHSLDQAGWVLCRDIVALGLHGTRWGIGLRGRRWNSRIEQALAEVDAADFADRRFGEVSGGQQQRISIAQALVTDPRLLVLDEPLAGLDLQGQVDLVELVHRINRRRGVTVLFVTHDLNPLLAHIDSVIYILDGTPRFGPVSQVVTAQLLTRLYGTPVQVTTTDDGCIYTRTH